MTRHRSESRTLGWRVGSLLLVALAGWADAAAAQVRLQLQGEPWFDGDMTLHVTDTGSVGSPVWVLLGFDPLPFHAPVATSAGPYFVGTLTDILFLGFLPGTGRLDVPFTMPPLIVGAEGLHLPLQAWVDGVLSNPATLPLDLPYYEGSEVTVIEHPLPSDQALFGDTVAAGDFNDDGEVDIAVGAWFEDIDGVDKAGRAYVMWGPDYTGFLVLEPTAPAHLLHFGQGLAVADFDGDGIDDLAIGEGTGGDPPTPGAHGHVYVFRGGSTFGVAPWITIVSAGTAQEAYIFGQLMRVSDIDGDDVPDVVIGAPDATVAGFTRAGRIEVFLGPTYGPALLIENPEPKANDFFGTGVSLADITGDGIVDIVEASGRAKVGNITQAGRLHVYDGPTLQWLATIDNPQPAANDRFGEGLWATDLDGDELAEVIVADVKKNFYVAWDPLGNGPISSWVKPPTPNPPGASASSFGYFFTATDANEDGRPDVVISDIFEGNSLGCGVLGAGGALYIAVAPYYATYERLVNPLGSCGDSFSWEVFATDLDGDGLDEFVAGDRTAEVGTVVNAGRVMIVNR